MAFNELEIILADAATKPIAWVDALFSLKGLRYDYKTDSLKDGDELLGPSTVSSQLRMACLDYGAAEVKSYLADALLLWKREQAKTFISQLRLRLAHIPYDDDHVAHWVRACTGKDSPLDIVVIRHFIWQVKRKLTGRPVEHHMMPVLFGRTGGGKSVAVQKLLESICDVAMSRDMSVFGDAFGKRQFSRNFVIFFDELSKSNTVDVKSLKNTITARLVEWRSMRSEGLASSPQNCTFIACSNDPVSERICDPTSARRFWQINCADQLDWGLINSIDYEALWRSIDESSECPIRPFLQEIQIIQNREIRSKDLIELWLESSCTPAPFDTDSPSTNELFEGFKTWCAYQGSIAHPGLQRFARGLDAKLKGLGWTSESKHSNRGTVWALRVVSSVGTISKSQ